MTSILICDNKPASRGGLTAQLKELGFTDLFACGDGKSAVELAFGRFPDLVLINSEGQENGGTGIAAEISKKLKIPILLLTDGYDAVTAKRASACGVAAILTKPLRKQDLLPAIEMAICHVEEVEALKEKIEDLEESIEDRKIIARAKGLLMEREQLSETAAHQKMQKIAMNSRKSLRHVAVGILKGG